MRHPKHRIVAEAAGAVTFTEDLTPADTPHHKLGAVGIDAGNAGYELGAPLFLRNALQIVQQEVYPILIAAFAGDFRLAHAAGVEFLRTYCQVSPIPGDIVITTNGGAPLDQNLYQCVKGLTAAEATVNPGGTIILCAEMADGTGGEQFYRDMRDCESAAALFHQFCATPQAETVADQWQTQILCRILKDYRVIFVTRPEMQQIIEEMKMEYAPDLTTALAMAGEGTVTAIPDGVSVLAVKPE